MVQIVKSWFFCAERSWRKAPFLTKLIIFPNVRNGRDHSVQNLQNSNTNCKILVIRHGTLASVPYKNIKLCIHFPGIPVILNVIEKWRVGVCVSTVGNGRDHSVLNLQNSGTKCKTLVLRHGMLASVPYKKYFSNTRNGLDRSLHKYIRRIVFFNFPF